MVEIRVRRPDRMSSEIKSYPRDIFRPVSGPETGDGPGKTLTLYKKQTRKSKQNQKKSQTRRNDKTPYSSNLNKALIDFSVLTTQSRPQGATSATGKRTGAADVDNLQKKRAFLKLFPQYIHTRRPGGRAEAGARVAAAKNVIDSGDGFSMITPFKKGGPEPRFFSDRGHAEKETVLR